MNHATTVVRKTKKKPVSQIGKVQGMKETINQLLVSFHRGQGIKKRDEPDMANLGARALGQFQVLSPAQSNTIRRIYFSRSSIKKQKILFIFLK